MAESLTNFISGFKNPAKTNMYKLVFRGENGAVIPTGLDIRAKGAQLPTADVGILEIPYKGRKVKIPAERSFSEWTVTVMETNDMNVRRSFEKWMSVMDAEDQIKRNTAALATIDVVLLKGDNATPSITYTLYGAFPSSLASVDLSFDEQTAPLEYSVTFQYSYHKVV
jgi:hypothetical protein